LCNFLIILTFRAYQRFHFCARGTLYKKNYYCWKIACISLVAEEFD
jgi:hypothetical protein